MIDAVDDLKLAWASFQDFWNRQIWADASNAWGAAGLINSI